MGGLMHGCKSRCKDCLQQSKIAEHFIKVITCVIVIFHKVNSILMKNFGFFVAREAKLILGDSNDGIVDLYNAQLDLKINNNGLDQFQIKRRETLGG